LEDGIDNNTIKIFERFFIVEGRKWGDDGIIEMISICVREAGALKSQLKG
jgi:hypothetical protein